MYVSSNTGFNCIADTRCMFVCLFAFAVKNYIRELYLFGRIPIPIRMQNTPQACIYAMMYCIWCFVGVTSSTDIRKGGELAMQGG